jgi:hypothetical protein
MKVCAIVFSLIVGTGLAAGTATAATMSGSQEAALQHLQATAATAQAAIQASPQDLKLMVSAIKAQSVSQSRAVLLRHGFTEQQLEGGVTVFSHGLLPKKVKQGQFYYFHLGYSPLKIEVEGLP